MPALDFSLPTIFYDAPQGLVEQSDSLDPAAWTEVPYLRILRLRTQVAPGIDECTLRYHAGKQLREDLTAFAQYDFRCLNGKYVRVTIEDTTGGGANVIWYGIIEIDERDIDGTDASDGDFAGVQTLTAYGLLRMLERHTIASAWIDQGSNPEIEIGRGLTFNADDEGAIQEHGNRSVTGSGLGGVYLFSDKPRRQNEWDAFEAVRHVLSLHVPKNAGGTNVLDWRLIGDANYLTWYKIAGIPTDRRPTKAVLDDLIDRRRAAGYYVEYNASTAEAEVKTFSFSDIAVALPSGANISANTDQYTLVLDMRVDMPNPLVVNSEASHYDKVIVEGDYRTTTFTLGLDRTSREFSPDWTDDEEAEYRDGATTDDNESGWRRNAKFRAQEKLLAVYSRWVIDPDWTGRGVRITPGTVWTTELVAPPLSVGTGIPDTSGGVNVPLWKRGLRILDHLILKDRYNYAGAAILGGTYADSFTGLGEPEFSAPLVAVNTTCSSGGSSSSSGGGPAPAAAWENITKLAAPAWSEEEGRSWSAHVRILKSAPALQIDVDGGPQHFLARFNFAGAAGPVDPRDDPELEHAVDWQCMAATITVELDARLIAQQEIAAGGAGQQQRILRIQVPDARNDYVVPGTMVRVEQGIVITTEGGVVRNDYLRLQDIARAAAEWYGRPRKSLTFSVRQCRQIARLGYLITQVRPDTCVPGINSVITAITYDVEKCETTIETQYVELDFV